MKCCGGGFVFGEREGEDGKVVGEGCQMYLYLVHVGGGEGEGRALLSLLFVLFLFDNKKM